MEIEYIYCHRTPGSFKGSIATVFDTFIDVLSRKENCVIRKSYLKNYGWWPISMIINMMVFGIKSRVHKNRIFHITGDVHFVAVFMNPKNTILTVHDLVTLHKQDIPRYSRILCYWLWYYLPLKHLKWITCISEATKKDLIHFFPWSKDKIVVVNDAVDPRFVYTSKAFTEDKPRILHIGTRYNKNLERVIEALDGVQCHLRIIRELSKTQIQMLDAHKIEYSNGVNLTDDEMYEEYKKCDIVSFPSTFEGFGMPVIEGQATGRPVVTSNIEPMRSVAGDGAVLVDPYSVESIRDGFLGVKKENYDEIVERGMKNAKRFTSEYIANCYFGVYKGLCITY